MVFDVHIAEVFGEHFARLALRPVAGGVQRCPAVAVLGVDVSTAAQQEAGGRAGWGVTSQREGVE